MKLFVDDIRECPKGWELARTITEAIRLLWSGYVTEVSLDFDIRVCANKRCQSNRETFEPVYRYISTMPGESRPLIRIHTGNVEMGRKMAEMLGITPYDNKIFDPADYN